MSPEKFKIAYRYSRFWGYVAGKQFHRLYPMMPKDHPMNLVNRENWAVKIVNRIESFVKEGRL